MDPNGSFRFLQVLQILPEFMAAFRLKDFQSCFHLGIVLCKKLRQNTKNDVKFEKAKLALKRAEMETTGCAWRCRRAFIATRADAAARNSSSDLIHKVISITLKHVIKPAQKS